MVGAVDGSASSSTTRSKNGSAKRSLQVATVLIAFSMARVGPVATAVPPELPQEILDAIHTEAGDRVIFEDDRGILIIDTRFNPKRIYDPVDPQYSSHLQENVYRDLMRFMADGQREMVGLLLFVKAGGFVWPEDLRFQAKVTKGGRLLATAPMDLAVYALVGGEDSLEWIELGNGVTRTLAPREDRLVPPQLEGFPQVYRIYMFFPALLEIGGEYSGWDPFNRKEVRIEPVR